MPKVVVVMSVYNEEAYLPLALQSVLTQDYEHFEIWVVDDGSCDRTPEILEYYACRDPRLHVIRHERQKGLASSLNEAISVSHGKYIVRMDGDDVCHPKRLSRQIAFLESRRDVGVLGTGCFYIDEQGKVLGEYIPPREDSEIRRLMPKYNSLVHPTIVMRREVFQQVGGYDPRFKFSQDYELWSRIARYTKFANLPHPLLYYRLNLKHVTQVCRKHVPYSIFARLWWLRRNPARLIDWFWLVRPLFWLFLPRYFASRVFSWRLARSSRLIS